MIVLGGAGSNRPFGGFHLKRKEPVKEFETHFVSGSFFYPTIGN
ncbi:hypothetical protein [Jeotgalibacillus campisalis]|uniref:Uncharacterized protein n=1 Tax=Jeotgalibacillus campisalis TaxID=220754 RepID=A0A0C2VU67_9BACL|nr:hypothetical protein [Jeotgalibacillus campisalis]KIL47513.1 hypothetical protein KR50_16800 [Jeotgalibacillus campisalis]